MRWFCLCHVQNKGKCQKNRQDKSWLASRGEKRVAGIETVKKVARVGRKNKIRSIVKKKGYNKSKEIVKKI